MKYYLSNYVDEMYSYNLIKTSYLQKMIRRGYTGKALSIADLYIKNNQEKALVRRLYQIWAEDISVASPNGIMVLNDPNYSIDQKITYLCQTPKSREADHFLVTVDYAREVLNMKEMSEDQLKEVQVLIFLLDLCDKWFSAEKKEKKAAKLALEKGFNRLCDEGKHNGIIKSCLDHYYILSKAKVHGARVMIAAAILISLRRLPLEETDINQLIIPQREEIDEIPDYVLDIHTPLGKKLKKTVRDWATHGAVIFPDFEYPSKYNSKGEEKYPLEPIIEFLEKRKARYITD